MATATTTTTPAPATKPMSEKQLRTKEARLFKQFGSQLSDLNDTYQEWAGIRNQLTAATTPAPATNGSAEAT